MKPVTAAILWTVKYQIGHNGLNVLLSVVELEAGAAQYCSSQVAVEMIVLHWRKPVTAAILWTVKYQIGHNGLNALQNVVEPAQGTEQSFKMPSVMAVVVLSWKRQITAAIL